MTDLTRPPVVMAAHGVDLRLGGRQILSDIDLELHAGELLVLVGPNGAGKSTLLAALAGDRAPTKGEIVLDGRPLRTYSAAQAAVRRSVLTQSNEVSFPFRVEEVVRMGRAPWRRRPEADRDDELVAAAMDAGEVARFAAQSVTALSGGERAHVAFARARAQDCTIAMLDEPTASLDIRHQHRVLAETRARTRDGGAAVVVLHDLGLAAAYTDRIAVLDEGRLVTVGEPRDVLRSDLLTEVYRHPVSVFDGPFGELVVAAIPSASGSEDPSATPLHSEPHPEEALA